MDMTTIGHMLDRFGWPLTLLGAIVYFVAQRYLPRLWNKEDKQEERDGKREDILMNTMVDTLRTGQDFNKEVSKNMAEGNVILSSLGAHMSSINTALENVVKRLEISDVKVEERHQANIHTNQRMFDMFEDIKTSLQQNCGDNRQILQKHESAERNNLRSKKKGLSTI